MSRRLFGAACGVALLSSTAACSLLIESERFVRATEDASVGNTPPVLSSVGLASYDVALGDVVRAVPGPVFDRDGDTFEVHYEWHDGAVLLEETGPTLDTTRLLEGAQVGLVAWARDATTGADGPTVFAEGVVVGPNAIRWRQRAPSEGAGEHPFILDAPNQRLIRLLDGGVWEYAIGAGDRLHVALLPNGSGAPPPESDLTTLMYGASRLFVHSGLDPAAVHVTSLYGRGPVFWERCVTGSGAPAPTSHAMVHYDEVNRRFWVIGGLLSDAEGATSSITALQPDGSGSCAGLGWLSIAVTGDPLPPIYGAAIAEDPFVTGRVYVIGGATTSGGTPSMVDDIYQLDLTLEGASVRALGVSLSTGIFGAGAAGDAATGQIIVAGGLTGVEPGAGPLMIHAFDPAIPAFGAVGPLPDPVRVARVEPHPYDPGAFLIAGDSAFEGDDAVRPVVSRYRPLTDPRTIADAPHPREIADAFASFAASELRILGGTREGRTTNSDWSLDPSTLEWTRRGGTTPDVVTGGHPTFGAQVVSAVISTGPPFGSWLVGGLYDDATIAEMTAWELGADDAWVEHLVPAGPAPPGRFGHVLLPSSCAGGGVIVLGGEDTSGAPFPEVLHLDCSAGTRMCTWTAIPAPDAARSLASIVRTPDGALVFGGRNAMGPRSDVILVPTCSTSGSVMPVAVGGATVSPRSGHAAAWDNARTAMFTFGGNDGTTLLNDTYRLAMSSASTGAWEELIDTGTPPSAREGHIAVWDATGSGRLLVVGGRGRGDVWELRLLP